MKPQLEELEPRLTPAADPNLLGLPPISVHMQGPPPNPYAMPTVQLNAILGMGGAVMGVSPAALLTTLQANYSAWWTAHGAAWNAAITAAGPADAPWIEHAPPSQTPPNTYSTAAPPTAEVWQHYSAAFTPTLSQPVRSVDLGAYGTAWLKAHHEA